MAAISASLAKSLDALRDAILEATSYLSRTPGADGQYVRVDELCMDDSNAYLEFIELDGQLKLVITQDPPGPDDAPRELLDLPVAKRMEAARYLPELIDLARKKSDELPPAIDAITGAIRASLGKAAGPTVSVGSEMGAHQSNIPNVESLTVSIKPVKTKK